jgi:hypothetical protein
MFCTCATAYDRFTMSGYVIRDSDEIIRTYTTDKVQLSHANSASFHCGSQAAAQNASQCTTASCSAYGYVTCDISPFVADLELPAAIPSTTTALWGIFAAKLGRGDAGAGMTLTRPCGPILF